VTPNPFRRARGERSSSGDAPLLSVIVCVYDMAREAPRTIVSAAAPYQQGVTEGDYEVLVVDNGSPRPLAESIEDELPAGVRLVEMPEPQPSPVFAMNWAAREVARGDVLLFAIDGARIFTDRLYERTLAAQAAVPDALVYTHSWHLGPKRQMESVHEGYNQEVEDALIAGSGWPEDRSALFDVSVFAGSSHRGFFAPAGESTAFSVPRTLWEAVGGYDERFTSPGGGLANMELFGRYVTRPDARTVCLLSEGTFHQVHGGIATSGASGPAQFAAEYEAIFGHTHSVPDYDPLYLGPLRPEQQRFLNP
jgi:glycosyltransferase involved in cell wall biosynthesis